VRGSRRSANAVKVPGPKARTWCWSARPPAYDHQLGVIVAREIELEDPFENMGARCGEVASKTSEWPATGTTTAMVAAEAIVLEA